MCCLTSKINSKIDKYRYLASTTYSILIKSTFTVQSLQYQQCSAIPQHYFLPFSTSTEVATHTQEMKLFLLNIYRKFQGNFPFIPTHSRNISKCICIYFSFFRTDGFPYWISTLSTLIFLTVKHTLSLPCVLRLAFFIFFFSTLLHLSTFIFQCVVGCQNWTQ
jgi:hypothetical protein